MLSHEMILNAATFGFLHNSIRFIWRESRIGRDWCLKEMKQKKYNEKFWEAESRNDSPRFFCAT